MMHALRNAVGNLRGLLGYAVVNSVDDTGGAQTVNVSTGTGVDRADVEVLEAFGFSSVPPADGAVTVVLALGGDPGNLVAFQVANPWTRFGGKKPGEAVMYGLDGSRVHIRQGGIVEIWAGAAVVVNTKTATVNAEDSVDVHSDTMTITAPGGTVINGPFVHNPLEGGAPAQFNGSLTATGDVSDGHGALNRLRENYNAHSHPPDATAPPTPLDPE